MEYIALDSFPHYAECEKITSELGFHLVELKISKSGKTTKIYAVISAADPEKTIGVNDCSLVHHALLPKLEEILGTDDTYMELTSPGTERNIKNAAEFTLFKGRQIRVWSRAVTEWVEGKLVSADSEKAVLKVVNKDGSEEEKTFPFEDIAKAKFIHL